MKGTPVVLLIVLSKVKRWNYSGCTHWVLKGRCKLTPLWPVCPKPTTGIPNGRWDVAATLEATNHKFPKTHKQGLGSNNSLWYPNRHLADFSKMSNISIYSAIYFDRILTQRHDRSVISSSVSFEEVFHSGVRKTYPPLTNHMPHFTTFVDYPKSTKRAWTLAPMTPGPLFIVIGTERSAKSLSEKTEAQKIPMGSVLHKKPRQRDRSLVFWLSECSPLLQSAAHPTETVLTLPRSPELSISRSMGAHPQCRPSSFF